MTYTLKQLKNMCKEQGKRGYSKMKKNELMELLGMNAPVVPVAPVVLEIEETTNINIVSLLDDLQFSVKEEGKPDQPYANGFILGVNEKALEKFINTFTDKKSIKKLNRQKAITQIKEACAKFIIEHNFKHHSIEPDFEKMLEAANPKGVERREATDCMWTTIDFVYEFLEEQVEEYGTCNEDLDDLFDQLLGVCITEDYYTKEKVTVWWDDDEQRTKLEALNGVFYA